MPIHEGVVAELFERAKSDHRSWINGNSGPYEMRDDNSSILGAFGGSAVGTTEATVGQRRAVTQFVSGTGEVELINSGTSGDTAWLVMVERAAVIFVGRDKPRRWELRVTEIFVRRAREWVRVHRHADPLVDRHPLEEILQLMS